VLLVALPVTADAIDDYVRAEMQRQRIPGLALAIIRDGQPVKVRGYGVANVELGTPVGDDTVFRISSISKQFLATAAVLLAADGELALDDRVSEHLGDAPEAWADITVRHLLTHTSGLRQESPGFDGLANAPNGQLVRNAYAEPLLFEPGKRFAYSNLAYYVLAEVIEAAAGKPWADVLAERIFAPLAMMSTRTTSVIDVVPHRATGHIFRDGTLTNAPPLITMRASGALLSSIADMTRWDAALSARRLVSPAMQTLMWTPVRLPDGSPTNYGFGWWADEVKGHRRIRHGGTNPGFAAEYSRFVDDDLSVVVLTNGGCARPDAIALDVAEHFVPGISPPRATVVLDPKTLTTLAGRYEFAPNNAATIAVDGTSLSVQGDSPIFSSQCNLLPESPTTFFISRDESYVFTVENGVATQLAVEFGGQRAVAVKLE
jgi:CubicO group peptidase (beta-lactamase class C family)